MNNTKNFIKVAQVNMNRNRIVPIQILDYAIKEKIDVLLLQEMPWSGGSIYGLEVYKDRTICSFDEGPALASIIILNDDIEILAITALTNKYFAVATIRKNGSTLLVIISAYFKYEIPTQNFISELDKILNIVGENVIIGADVNAHSPLWHSRTVNKTGLARGKHVENLINDQRLVINNRQGYPETYSRKRMGSSNIDVTLSRGDTNIDDWQVLCDICDSDHRSIIFKISFGVDMTYSKCNNDRLNIKKADWDKYRQVLAQSLGNTDFESITNIEQSTILLMNLIKSAMKASMPTIRPIRRTKPPWWTQDLTNSKKRLLAFRRKSDYKNQFNNEYKILRNNHLRQIRKAKAKAWKSFSDSINDDIWGKAYKWCKLGIKRNIVSCAVKNNEGNFTTTALETAQCLLDTLIPSDACVQPPSKKRLY